MDPEWLIFPTNVYLESLTPTRNQVSLLVIYTATSMQQCAGASGRQLLGKQAHKQISVFMIQAHRPHRLGGAGLHLPFTFELSTCLSGLPFPPYLPVLSERKERVCARVDTEECRLRCYSFSV